MKHRLLGCALLCAAIATGSAVAEDHHDANPKLLAKVKESAKGQKDHPKAKGDLAKDTSKKLHDLESKAEAAIKAEEKVDAKANGKPNAACKKADGAAQCLSETIKHAKSVEGCAGQFCGRGIAREAEQDAARGFPKLGARRVRRANCRSGSWRGSLALQPRLQNLTHFPRHPEVAAEGGPRRATAPYVAVSQRPFILRGSRASRARASG